ncbi:MAG: hypothetical protein WCL16_00905 [bacterium]
MIKAIIACAAFALLGAGCATVTIEKVSGTRPQTGLRFYRPEPYLLVTDDNKQLSTRVIYLPNRAEEYVIHPHVFLAKQEFNVKLQDGWNLVDFGHTSDTSPAATLDAINGTIGNFTTLKASASSSSLLTPGLYRFVYRGGRLAGLEPVSLSISPLPSDPPQSIAP